MQTWIGIGVGLGLLIASSNAMAAYTMKRSGFFTIPHGETLTRTYRCPVDANTAREGKYVPESGRAYWAMGGGLEPFTTGVKIKNRTELARGYRATLTNNSVCSLYPTLKFTVLLVIELSCRYPGEQPGFPGLLLEGEGDVDEEGVLLDDVLENLLNEEER